MEHFELESKLLIISTFTVDKILKETSHPADCLALYNFYYYTAKWQETNQPEATTGYCSKGLGISEDRVRQAKKELIRLKLIEDVTVRDAEQKISGWYIKVCYVWKETTLPEIQRVEKSDTNALSVSSLNALSVTKEIPEEKPIKKDLVSLNGKSSLPSSEKQTSEKFNRAWLENFIATKDMAEAEVIANVPRLKGFTTAEEVMETAENMPDWCDANGKTYKSWRGALIVWVARNVEKRKQTRAQRKAELKLIDPSIMFTEDF